MDTKDVNLFVYDTRENFERTREFLEGFKELICIENVDDLAQYLDSDRLSDDEYVYAVIHVFAFEKLKGVRKFFTSRIRDRYPNLGYMYISDGDESKIRHEMLDEKVPDGNVYKYHQVYSGVRDGIAMVRTKRDVRGQALTERGQEQGGSRVGGVPHCDYAIMTALEAVEMEKILPMLTKVGEVTNREHLIEYGHLKTNVLKTIAYASQSSPGMVDAAILATELIMRFRPKLLIMPGVLGGKPDELKIGDVVVASRVFTIDKGKLDDYGFRREIEASDTGSAYLRKIERQKVTIRDHVRKEDVTRDSQIEIHFGSIACVRAVIDAVGYFEEQITPVDRKALALEMESYGVSRACKLINDGNTIPLIIKAVMDNTKDKVDGPKPYAGWASAEVVRYILENNII